MLRIWCLLVGALFLVLIPLGFFLRVSIVCPLPAAAASPDNWQVMVFNIGSEGRGGTLRIGVLESQVMHQGKHAWKIDVQRVPFTRFSIRFVPTWHRSPPFAVYNLPLWLLAAVCLAWPATSFFVARRRRNGRGFEVEATSGATPRVGGEPASEP